MIKKVLFKISGMHCTSCAFNIDGELEDADGVVESRTNYAKAETQVTFDDTKINTQKILRIIGEVGYSADIPEPN